MDPITAVGAVASIITLAQTALSLSKALYTLGSAVQSASEDIEALADDLKTFAQSLNLLSRLLEDSKSWYSDDVYLLTAKIIKDCADLYEKIDKILVKLGGNGKNTWKIRMKFVYKEGQIRKLMKRLRDMKGNLATVLMSLQVDLQLSLLNISSSSKIQRSPEKELDSETIRHLKAAQNAVESCNFLPKYSSESDLTLNDEKSLQAKVIDEPRRLKSFAPLNDTHSFIALSGSHEPSDTAAKLVCKSTTGPLFAQLNPANHEKADESEFRSLKSVSSTESFKSAVSVQKELLDLAHEVKAVKSVLHAFRTALDTLDSLIERRIPNRDACYPAALQLKLTLFDGQKQVEDTHLGYCKKFGIHYVKKWKDADSGKLHDISIHMMRAVVTSLHMLSAEHEVLNIGGFEALYRVCEKCRGETVGVLYAVAYDGPSKPNITPPCPDYNIYTQKPRTPNTSEPLRKEAPEKSLPFIGYNFKRFETNYEPPVNAQTELPKPEVVLSSPSSAPTPVSIPNSRDLVGPSPPMRRLVAPLPPGISGLSAQSLNSSPVLQRQPPPSLGHGPSNLFRGIGAGPSSMFAPASLPQRSCSPNSPVSTDAMDSLFEKLRAAAPPGGDQRDRRRRARLQNPDELRVASGQNIPHPAEGGTMSPENDIAEQSAMILQTQQQAGPESRPVQAPAYKRMKGLKGYRARRLKQNKKGLSLADPKAQKNDRTGEDKPIDIPTGTLHSEGATDYSSQQPVMNGYPSTSATPNPNHLRANFCSSVSTSANDDEESDLQAATGLEAMRVAEEQEQVGPSRLSAKFAFAQEAQLNHAQHLAMASQQQNQSAQQALAFQQQNHQFQLQQQQHHMIQQQQRARQMMQQHYSGLPNQQLSQAQYQAMQRANPGMARPVNLPKHLQQAQAGLQAQHTLQQQQQGQVQQQHQQRRIAQQIAMQHQAAQNAQGRGNSATAPLIYLPNEPLHSPAYSPTSPGIEFSFDSFQPSDNDFGLEREDFNFDRFVVDGDQKDEEMGESTEAPNLSANHLAADLNGSAPNPPVSPGAVDFLLDKPGATALQAQDGSTRRHESVPKVVTVEREPEFVRNQGGASDHSLHDAEAAYQDTSHPTVPIAEGTIEDAAAIVAGEEYRGSRSEKRRSERRRLGREPDRDPIQEGADKAYREIVMAQRVASQAIRSSSASPGGSVAGKEKADLAQYTAPIAAGTIGAAAQSGIFERDNFVDHNGPGEGIDNNAYSENTFPIPQKDMTNPEQGTPIPFNMEVTMFEDLDVGEGVDYDSQTQGCETGAITKFMVPYSIHGASDNNFAYEDNSDLYDSAQPLPPSEIGPYSGLGYELSSFVEPGKKQEGNVHAMESSESSKSPSPIPQKRKRVNTRQNENNNGNERKKTPSSIKKPEETPPALFYPLGDLQQVQVQEETPNSRDGESLKRCGRGGRGGFSGRRGGKAGSVASPSHEDFNESFRQQRESLVSKSGLQTDENSDLWSAAYENMCSSKAMGYIILSIEIENLGIETLPHSQIAKELSKLVRDMPTILNPDPRFAEVLATRDSIIAILKMVDQQLGFELALVGWSCVWKLLSNHEDLLSPENENFISTLKNTYAQLLEITGLIARYAVMENLYRNSPTMTLKPEYKSSLYQLCLTMLCYFSSAFELRRAQLTEVKTDGGTNEAVFSEEHKLGLEKQHEWRCGALLGEIRVADDLCRGFKVVVDVKEDSESEMSGEDGSDESWEQVGEEEGMSDAIVV